MLGLRNGLSLGRSPRVTPNSATALMPIVAWGDSLTQGTGSTSGATYPVQAGTLLGGNRSIFNEGVGGQSAASIAARQGGLPILVSVENNLIPAHQNLTWSWSFADNMWGVSHFGGDRGGSAQVVDGRLVVDTPDWLQGILIPLGQTLPKNTPIQVTVDATIPAGMTLRVSGFLDYAVSWAANDGQGTEGKNLTTSGTHTFTIHVGGLGVDKPTSMNQLVFLTESAPTGGTSFTLKNLTVSALPDASALSVPIKSVSAINPGSSFSGTLAGVHGTMTSDLAGNWSFKRDALGTSVVCPTNSQFAPEAATQFQHHTNWIWVGNNGIGSPGDVAPAVQLVSNMAANLGHTRYLVLGALPRPDRVTAIAQFNAAMAAAFGPRFVDVLTPLRAAGNGSPGDLADLSAGLVPRSLRIDDIHLTTIGYGIVAQAVAQAMLAKRW